LAHERTEGVTEMTKRYRQLYADHRGIWEEVERGRAVGMEWEMIQEISGYKEEGLRKISTEHVRVEFDCGNFHTELTSDVRGFEDVVKAASKYLPGIRSNWFERLERLKPKDESLTVWQRPQEAPLDGYPRLDVDDRGVWCERRPRRRFVVEWDSIAAVNGQRTRTATGEVVATGLELELSHQALGVFLEAAWPGFDAVVDALTDRLPGLREGWFARIPELRASGVPRDGHAVLRVRGLLANPTVWQRGQLEELKEPEDPEADGCPRVYADEEGVCLEEVPGEVSRLKWKHIKSVECWFSEGTHGETLVSVQVGRKNGSVTLGLSPDGHSEPSAEIVAAISAHLDLPPAWFVKAKELKPTRGSLPLYVGKRDPLRVDTRGVWLQHLDRADQLTEWDAIFGMLARRRLRHGHPQGAVSIELDLAGLGRRSLHEEEAGYAEVVEALTGRLPGMPADWRTSVERLQPEQATMVWRRTCAEGFPRLIADDRGVWRENKAGERFGQPWDGIWRILGRRLVGTPGAIEVELTGTGTGLVFQSDCQGFADVVEAIAARLPNLEAGWPDKLGRLPPGHALWRMDWAAVQERAGSDGMLAIVWRKASRTAAARPKSNEAAARTPPAPPEITEELARKVLAIIDKELSEPLFEPRTVFVSAERPLCDVLGRPRPSPSSDGLGWVSPALRTLTGCLHGCRWTSSKVRAEGLRRLALAQLGSHALDDREFARRVAQLTIRTVLPRALRAVAAALELAPTEGARKSAKKEARREAKREALLAAAERCEREGSRDAANAAEAAANAVTEEWKSLPSKASDIASGTWHAAIHAAKAHAAANNDIAYLVAGLARNEAELSAAAIAARPVEFAMDDVGRAVYYTGRNAETIAFAESVLKILAEMEAPGCRWLYLAEQPPAP
jgi:hypothetical protein